MKNPDLATFMNGLLTFGKYLIEKVIQIACLNFTRVDLSQLMTSKSSFFKKPQIDKAPQTGSL